jgi:DNA-binding response OmpR family regulator
MRQALIAGLGEDADVTGAIDVVQAIRFIAAFQPDVVVLDLLLDPRLPSWSNGVDIPRLLHERNIPVPPLIVLSGRPGGADIARSIGAAAYYRKPIDIDALGARIKELAGVDPGAVLEGHGQPAR